jgi:putative ABC transport system permease protein
MLMALREQTGDIGIMKSLGFTDGSMFGLLLAQAMLLSIIGGGLGILLAWSTQAQIGEALGAMFPGYVIKPSTFALAGVVTIGVGIVAGLVPAWRAGKLRCVEAFRGAE